MTQRELRLLRKLAERWCRELGYRSRCDSPTKGSYEFLHKRLVWFVQKMKHVRQESIS